MNKTIEKEFFEAFKWGGVVNNCIEWMRYIYNLPPIKPGDSKGCESLQNKEAKDNLIISTKKSYLRIFWKKQRLLMTRL